MSAWASYGRTAAAAVLLAALALPVTGAAPAAARECTGLAAAATTTGGRTQVLLSLPAALTGTPILPAEVSLVQDGLDLPVLSVADVPAAATDVVVVVDTSSGSAAAAGTVRAAATALLHGLPAATRAAVLTTGGSPAVVHELNRGPATAVAALADLTPNGANALVDTLLAGVRLLPADPGRQQQVVVVAAGADTGSTASWSVARQLLVRRGVALDVVDVGGSPSLPGAGAQCPGAVAAADAAGAAGLLAKHVEDRRLAVVPTLTGTSPVKVSVTHAGTTASTILTTRADAPGTAPAPRESGGGGAGAATLVLAFLVGLLGLFVLLLVIALRSSRGTAVRAALRELRAARSSALPAAEAARRRTDAKIDLQAALGGGPTTVQLAEEAAYDEEHLRAAELDHRRAAEERAAAYARAAQRRERSLQQADWRAATDRAAREATSRLDRLRALPTTGLAGADPAALAVLAEAEHAVTAQRLAAQEAMTRRAEAERLADEAEARAERERGAAAEAQRNREAAEAAAAEAAARAQEELRTAGAASEARRLAEAEASAAAAEAADERRAAEEAVARRMVAEAQAAEAEAAQDEAVHRELAALEAAEAAETARRDAVARMARDREAAEAAETADTADAAPLTVDLRQSPSLVSPAVDTAVRRAVVVPVDPPGRGSSAGAGTGAGGPAADEPPRMVPDPAAPAATAEPIEAAEPAATTEPIEPAEPAEAAGPTETGSSAAAAEVAEGSDANDATRRTKSTRPTKARKTTRGPKGRFARTTDASTVRAEAAEAPDVPEAAEAAEAPAVADASEAAAATEVAETSQVVEVAEVAEVTEVTDAGEIDATNDAGRDAAVEPQQEPRDVRLTEGEPPHVARARRWLPLRLVARGAAAAVVPAVVLMRTVAAPSSWSGLGTVGAVLLVVATALTALGVRWVWVATSPPYTLRRRTARRIVAAQQRQRGQADDAARLLTALREGTADAAAWDDFEQRTGLAVPASTRTAVDAGMDPAALVRYLSARQHGGVPTPQPLLVVAAVPLLVCLLPAVLLVLAS